MEALPKKRIVVSSPGRINLIGEHIDYNDGYVLPAAIDRSIRMVINSNNSNSRCTIMSKGYESILVIDLNNLGYGTEGWHNYVLGVIIEIQKLTNGLRGFDCKMESTLPVGSGVSSSAALECGLAYGLNKLFDLGLDNWQLIKVGQMAEHNFVGTKCGIMDQFTSVMGKEGHAILLDCHTLDFEYIPLEIDQYRLLLLNTNVAHNLSTSEYNVRREQCDTGLAMIAKKFNIEKSFRNVTPIMLEESRAEFGPILYNRCSFVVEEIHRVLLAVNALKVNDLVNFGKQMFLSHEGLSKKYEVSCQELDFLVDQSKSEPQVLGARMMGGGFGGCTLNLIHKDAIDDFVKKASKAYKAKFGIVLTHFQTLPSRGTSLIENSL